MHRLCSRNIDRHLDSAFVWWRAEWWAVRVQGQVQGQELHAAYASADIFMMPSESETLGFVVLEVRAPPFAPASYLVCLGSRLSGGYHFNAVANSW